MPDRLVLDASAAIAVLMDEPAGDRVLDALRQQALDGGQVVVPSHFWLEVANVLIRRYRHTPRDVMERMHVLAEFAPETIEVDRPLFLLALDRAARLGLSTYDAAYLALAESQEGRLLTLDARLRAAAGSGAVWIGPHRLSEEAAPYESDPSEVWAEFGGYLAELRRDALAR